MNKRFWTGPWTEWGEWQKMPCGCEKRYRFRAHNTYSEHDAWNEKQVEYRRPRATKAKHKGSK